MEQKRAEESLLRTQGNGAGKATGLTDLLTKSKLVSVEVTLDA